MSTPEQLSAALPGLRRLLVRLVPYGRADRGLVVGSIAALLAGTVLRLLEPWPLKFVFDQVIQVGPAGGGRVAIDGVRWGLEPTSLLAWAAVAVLGVTALRAYLQYLNQVGFAKIGNRVLGRVRADTFHHLQALPLSFHTAARSGDLLIRVIQDVNLLRDAAVTAILPLLASVLVLTGMWCVMFWMQWQLALLAAVIVPLLWLRAVRLAGRIREAAQQQRRRQGDLATTAAESIGAIKDVQALSLEGIFQDAFGSSNEVSQEHDVRSARLSASLGRSVDVLLAVATALVLYFGARLVLRQELSPGELLVFLTYLRRAFTPAQDFAKYTGRLAKATAAGERVLDLLDREPEVRDLPGAAPAPRFAGAVRFDDVSFEYELGQRVLDRMGFAVEAGQTVALVGASGIGKSTVVDLLLRFYDPIEGRVLIDGQDIRGFTLASLRAQISVVLQDTLLFAATVRENIARGSSGASDAEVEVAARLANAHDFVTALPRGYETVVGERGVTLSGGQRQRLAIARAALRDAPILVFDEPMSGLDEENRRAVGEALERLGRGRTLFLITHDLELASRADLVLYIADGRVVEQGSPLQLLASGGRFATLLRLAPGRARKAAGISAFG